MTSRSRSDRTGEPQTRRARNVVRGGETAWERNFVFVRPHARARTDGRTDGRIAQPTDVVVGPTNRVEFRTWSVNGPARSDGRAWTFPRRRPHDDIRTPFHRRLLANSARSDWVGRRRRRYTNNRFPIIVFARAVTNDRRHVSRIRVQYRVRAHAADQVSTLTVLTAVTCVHSRGHARIETKRGVRKYIGSPQARNLGWGR